MPLLLVLHGHGSVVDENTWVAGMSAFFRFEPLAEEHAVLLCYADGQSVAGAAFWSATDACCNFYGSEADDVSFLRGLIEEVARRYRLDRRRIYMSGISNGGFMSHRMAVECSDLIAGIAGLCGVTFLDPTQRQPDHCVNVLHIHGTADEIVPYGGWAFPAGTLPVTACFPGALATVQMWAAYNGCDGPVCDSQPSMDLSYEVAGPETTVLRYTNCPPGGAVELWTISGSPHVPGFTTESNTTVAEQKRIVARVEALLRQCDALEAQLHQTRTVGAHLLDATLQHLLAA